MAPKIPPQTATTTLAKYDAARTALAAAARVDEVKEIRDKADAMAHYARQAKDTDMIRWATEIKVRAERKAGDLLKVAADRGERQSRGAKANVSADDYVALPTLKDLKITRNDSSNWQRIAGIPEKRFEEIVSTANVEGGGLSTKRLVREARGVKTVKKKRGPSKTFKLSPIIQALSDLAKETKVTTAADVLNGLKQNFSKGVGVDEELRTEYVRVREWLDELIEGMAPYIVGCGLKETESEKEDGPEGVTVGA